MEHETKTQKKGDYNCDPYFTLIKQKKKTLLFSVDTSK